MANRSYSKSSPTKIFTFVRTPNYEWKRIIVYPFTHITTYWVTLYFCLLRSPNTSLWSSIMTRSQKCFSVSNVKFLISQYPVKVFYVWITLAVKLNMLSVFYVKILSHSNVFFSIQKCEIFCATLLLVLSNNRLQLQVTFIISVK